MVDAALVYRDQMVRAVSGERPAILAKNADTAALDRMARRLADAESAIEMLRAKGYGKRGMGILDMVKALPEATNHKETR
jgi:hypothetical protein